MGLRERLVGTLGAVDTYLAGLDKLRSAEGRVAADDITRVRENALLREAFLRQGLSPEELDAAGFISVEEIAHLEEEGLLEARVEGIVRKWSEELHPRGRGGKFASKPGNAPEGRVRKSSVGGWFTATGPKGELADRATKGQAATALKQMRNLEADKAKGKRQAATFADSPHEPFGGDPEVIAKGRAMILSGNPTTRDRYAEVRDGRVVYDRSRQRLHEQIINRMLTGIDQSDDPPQLFLTGGGMASGKGGVVDGHPPHPWKPTNALTLDADKIKAQLPEFTALQKLGDPEANLRVSEEAWDVSQALAAEARKRKVNVIADGVGNTSVNEVMERVRSYTEAGYAPPKAVYVTKDIDDAIRDARLRMQHAMASGKTESLRYIPDDMMRFVHAQVSKVFPDILREWPGDLELHETYTSDANGKFPDPKLILTKHDGEVTIHDPQAYDRFLEKAKLSP